MQQPQSAAPIKVACVTCYFDPDYVRSRTIRAALAADSSLQPIIIKNRSRGAWRYVQVLVACLRVRFSEQPDVWLLNFRGYELLPFMLVLAGRRPLIYDEFVNPVLVTNEHRLQKTGPVKALMGVWNVFGGLYYLLLRRCRLILADTEPHGRHAATLAGLDPARYRALPVGTDETVFKLAPRPAKPARPFQVFFYSTGIQPLHGTEYVLEAAVLLKQQVDIEFLISGKRGRLGERVAAAVERGARITHRDWIPFDELPSVISASGVCLGGPFGNTPQAQMVITTKAYQFLASAAPLIVGASPATAIMHDKQTALVVPQADAAALAEAILWAYKHPSELAAMALAGRQLYEAEFSQAHINRLLSSVVHEVAGR